MREKSDINQGFTNLKSFLQTDKDFLFKFEHKHARILDQDSGQLLRNWVEVKKQ